MPARPRPSPTTPGDANYNREQRLQDLRHRQGRPGLHDQRLSRSPTTARPHGATGTCTGVNGRDPRRPRPRRRPTPTSPAASPTGRFTDATGNYNGDSGSVDIDIAKADPACAISGVTLTYDGAAHGATGDCLGVNGETLAGLDRGASYTDVPGGTADWTFTDETGNYTDDSGSVDITIGKADQAIDFPPLPDVTISAHTIALGAVEGVVYTSLTPGVCTVSGTTVTLLAPGTCTIEATMAGDANHNAATPVIQTFAVTSLPDTTTDGANPMLLLVGLLTLMALGGPAGPRPVAAPQLDRRGSSRLTGRTDPDPPARLTRRQTEQPPWMRGLFAVAVAADRGQGHASCR